MDFHPSPLCYCSNRGEHSIRSPSPPPVSGPEPKFRMPNQKSRSQVPRSGCQCQTAHSSRLRTQTNLGILLEASKLPIARPQGEGDYWPIMMTLPVTFGKFISIRPRKPFHTPSLCIHTTIRPFLRLSVRHD